MAVRIRMKKLGRLHRPFFRICAMDAKRPRDGRVIEELGIYDPMVPDTDLRCVLERDRVAYWLGVGAQPSDKVKVLIKKYGNGGTHLAKQESLLAQRQGLPSTPGATVAAAPAPPAKKPKGKKAEAAPPPAEA